MIIHVQSNVFKERPHFTLEDKHLLHFFTYFKTQLATKSACKIGLTHFSQQEADIQRINTSLLYMAPPLYMPLEN